MFWNCFTIYNIIGIMVIVLLAEGLLLLIYLSANKSRLQKEYHLTKIGLFGSIARGDNHSKSDIDIIVEFEPETKNLYLLLKPYSKKLPA